MRGRGKERFSSPVGTLTELTEREMKGLFSWDVQMNSNEIAKETKFILDEGAEAIVPAEHHLI